MLTDVDYQCVVDLLKDNLSLKDKMSDPVIQDFQCHVFFVAIQIK